MYIKVKKTDTEKQTLGPSPCCVTPKAGSVFLMGQFCCLLCPQPSDLCDTFCGSEPRSPAPARRCWAAGGSAPGLLWGHLTSVPPASEHVRPFWGITGKLLHRRVTGSALIPATSLGFSLHAWRGIWFLLLQSVSLFPSQICRSLVLTCSHY